MEKTITIELTEAEAKEVLNVLTNLNGRLQWRAVKKVSGELDESWGFWNRITQKISKTLGFSYCVNTKESRDLIN